MIASVHRRLARYLSWRSSSLAFWWLPCRAWPEGIPVVGDRGNGSSFPDYFIDLSAKAKYALHLDADGVPMLDYLDGAPPRYNPCAISQFGLGAFSVWARSGDDAALDQVAACARWLLANGVDGPEDSSLYLYDFGAEIVPDLAVPYCSAIAQSQAASLLFRAARALGDQALHTQAIRSARIIPVPVSEGGLMRTGPGDATVFEEFPAATLHAVLDGHLYAVAALIDANHFAADQFPKAIVDHAQQGARSLLSAYDLGYWSRTDLYGLTVMVASPFYHKLHVTQLTGLYALTGNPVFADYRDIFGAYQASPICRGRAFVEKAWKKIAYY